MIDDCHVESFSVGTRHRLTEVGPVQHHNELIIGARRGAAPLAVQRRKTNRAGTLSSRGESSRLGTGPSPSNSENPKDGPCRAHPQKNDGTRGQRTSFKRDSSGHGTEQTPQLPIRRRASRTGPADPRSRLPVAPRRPDAPVP